MTDPKPIHMGCADFQEESECARIVYSPPHLREYGKIRNLTSSGSSGKTEGMMKEADRKP